MYHIRVVLQCHIEINLNKF